MFLIDDYDDSRQHMTMYLESGSVETPSHGRGKRASRPNTKYLESDEDVDIERVLTYLMLCMLLF